MPGTLYIVSTPIGNLEDMTLRAVRILKEVGVIAAEDTRHTKQLCTHFGIHTPLTSYHDFNKKEKTAVLLERLQAGTDVALVSDAGTPVVSDPGFFLITRAIEAGIRVVPAPGPSAVLAALAGSGLPTDAFPRGLRLRDPVREPPSHRQAADLAPRRLGQSAGGAGPGTDQALRRISPRHPGGTDRAGPKPSPDRRNHSRGRRSCEEETVRARR